MQEIYDILHEDAKCFQIVETLDKINNKLYLYTILSFLFLPLIIVVNKTRVLNKEEATNVNRGKTCVSLE